MEIRPFNSVCLVWETAVSYFVKREMGQVKVAHLDSGDIALACFDEE